MASNNGYQVDTEQLRSQSSQMSNLNNNLYDTLGQGQTTVTNMNSVWDSPAAKKTIQAFNDFTNRYHDSYRDIIDNFSQFLNDSATEYENAEQENQNKFSEVDGY